MSATGERVKLKPFASLSGFLAALGFLAAAAQALELQPTEATAEIHARTDEPVIHIRLNLASARAFGRLTAENVGRKADIRIDGKSVMQPVIREPILGGSLLISGPFGNFGEAQNLAKRLSSGKAKLEVELVSP